MIARTPRTLRAAALLLAAFVVAGCPDTVNPAEHRAETFKVEILETNPTSSGRNGESPETALPIPLGTIKFKVRVTAIDERGQKFETFDRPLSFRITPGQVVETQLANGTVTADRMIPSVAGVAEGWVVVQKVFGEAYIWAVDSPPKPVFQLPAGEEGTAVDAGTPGPTQGGYEEVDGGREYTSGVSRTIYFVHPKVADVQRLPLLDAKCKVDNKVSPFTGNFLTIDATDANSDLIVTAITNEGFYVTDLKAQRLDLQCYSSTLSTFGHLFVYNFSYPDGLFLGDRLLSVTGTVQEFSGATQLVFPSWVRREGQPRPEDIPAPTVFDFSNQDVKNPSAGYRICKLNTDPKYPPKFPSMEQLCAYSNNNIDIETLESSLVKIVNAKPSTVFANCDLNGNSNIPPFRWMVTDGPSGPDWDNAAWGCDPGPDSDDCTCNMRCVTSIEEFAGKVCSESNTMREFGQWLVQLEDKWKTRINVHTRDALPEFNPREFSKPEYEGCTIDITGILRQVQAARPRWLIQARDRDDVCCRAPENKTCPPKIPVCPKGQQ